MYKIEYWYFILIQFQVEDYPNGNFVGPTIITNMNQSMEAYKNEIFGPVLCVLSADSLEEAIELVNRWLGKLLKSILHIKKM